MIPSVARPSTRLLRPLLALGLLLVPGLPLAGSATGHAASVLAPKQPPVPASAPLPSARIIAVVNGDVISNTDVDDRARLFAMSTGLPISSDVLDRLKPQILQQLINERLRVQASQRLKVVIADTDIAAAIRDIEQRNGLQPGALRQKLAADGVSERTLIDQIRAQLAWTQVLRQQLADKLNVTDAEIDEQLRLFAQQTGKPEYRVAEIFIPVNDPGNTADAERFADTVIKELHAGAPFPIVAAQFSQTQTALEGGELGWVQPNQLDTTVARLVTEMPIGAISNPVKVPGGLSIVALQGKREIGRDLSTILSIRQVFLPFTSPLNPQAPTEQQQQTLVKARNISATVNGCEQMEQIAKAANPSRPANPGDVRLEAVNPPQFRQVLATLPIGKPSQPLVGPDGIGVVTVCSRDQKNVATPSRDDIRRQLISERVELLSRQLMRDLRRQASIEIRRGGV
jgi:peptidyl-prolyl cis-trans isomerase SurA